MSANIVRSPDAQSMSANYLDLDAAIRRYNAMATRESAALRHGSRIYVRQSIHRCVDVNSLICNVAWIAVAERMTSAWVAWVSAGDRREGMHDWVHARIKDAMFRGGIG